MPFVDFAALKQRVRIEDVLPELGLEMKQHAGQWRGPCPACRSGGNRALVVTPDDDVHVGIYHLGEEVDAAQCQGGGTDEAMFDLPPGTHHFVVEVDPRSERDLSQTPVLFSLVDETE